MQNKNSNGVSNQLKKYLGSTVTILFVIGVFVAIYYTAVFFREEEEKVRSENPIVFCQPENAPPEDQTPLETVSLTGQKCFFTTHIHAYPTIKVSGEEKPLPFEYGDLTKHHTHAQINKIHWHSLISVDPETKRAPDSEFQLGKMFDDLGIYFDSDGIFDSRNGEINPKTGRPAQVKLLVNGKENAEFREYVWKDKDNIEIIFE